MRKKLLATIALVAVLAVAGCGGGSKNSSNSKNSAGGGEAASAATGDIPDNQVFLVYKGPGYSIKYPEGWTKKGSGRDLRFSDKDNSVHLVLGSGQPPVKLSHGRAKLTLRRQGQPNPVTGQRPQLVIDRYVYGKRGRVATLDLATPKGVDNVDAYRLISNSFKWQ
jgi:hypothetical protein